MAKTRRTETLRTDPDFKKFVLDLSRIKSEKEKDEIKSSRITQAMFNQYQKHPELISEIKFKKLGRWK